MIKATAELGIPENMSYNSGDNMGMSVHQESYNISKMFFRTLNINYFILIIINVIAVPTTHSGSLILGITKMHVTTKNGSRWSTAKAYLRPAMHRSNLHVVTEAHVTKVHRLIHTYQLLHLK